MKKKLLSKIIPSPKAMEKAVENSPEVKGIKAFFRNHFKNENLWKKDKQTIARGVAAGFAAAVVPGIQFFYAAILVVLLQGNLPVALVCTLITNPLTVVPIMYFIYYIGTLIIGNGDKHFVVREFHWDFSSFHAFWTNVSGWALQFGKAFLIGLPVVSLFLGIVGYFGVLIFWKLASRIFNKMKK